MQVFLRRGLVEGVYDGAFGKMDEVEIPEEFKKALDELRGWMRSYEEVPTPVEETKVEAEAVEEEVSQAVSSDAEPTSSTGPSQEPQPYSVDPKEVDHEVPVVEASSAAETTDQPANLPSDNTILQSANGDSGLAVLSEEGEEARIEDKADGVVPVDTIEMTEAQPTVEEEDGADVEEQDPADEAEDQDDKEHVDGGGGADDSSGKAKKKKKKGKRK